MLYHLLYRLHETFSILNVTRYITFRTAAASITALIISLAFGGVLIRKLREFQIGQVIRHEGPESHRPKAGTPTMGGLLILAASIIPTLLWADLTNAYIWIAVLSTLAFGAIGFADDYLKITRRNHHGLLPRYKSGGQMVVALLGRRHADRPREQGALQHPADLPVLQGPDPGPRAAVRAVRRARARRLVQRGEPHRRPRWAGDQLLRRRGGDVHGAGLRHRAPRACRVPAARAVRPGRRS